MGGVHAIEERKVEEDGFVEHPGTASQRVQTETGRGHCPLRKATEREEIVIERGVAQLAECGAHNPEVAGSSPAPATTSVRASESQHWYTRAGEPMYEIAGADGVLRPTTLRDARKLNLVPSVSTIIKCAAAPGLERWKQEQNILAALTLPRKDGEGEADWLDRVRQDAKEQARKAAQRGQDIHAAIQRHLGGEAPIPKGPYQQHVIGTAQRLLGLFPFMDYIPRVEHAFAHPDGFGGKLDYWHMEDGEDGIADFKTKEFDESKTVKDLAWDEHCIQLAAYRRGINRPNAKCLNIFVSTTVPGLALVRVWEEQELERGLDMFRALLNYYQAKARYVSAF